MSRDETREEAKGDYQSRKGSLLRLEPMMSSLARLFIYQARVNICPTFLILFQGENLDMVLNVIRE